MEPELSVDPDALRRVADTARRIADGLPPCPPGHPHPSVRRDAAAEIVAFAEAAERAAGRVSDVDDEVAAGLFRIDEMLVGADGPLARRGTG